MATVDEIKFINKLRARVQDKLSRVRQDFYNFEHGLESEIRKLNKKSS